MTKLTAPTPRQTQPQTRPKPTPNIPKPTPNTAPSPPSQKSSSKPTFFPCAKLQVSFSPLSGSNRDGEEGKVLKRWSRMALGWLWDGSGMALGCPTCGLEGEGRRELKSDPGSFHKEMAQHCQEGFFHCTATIGLMTGKLIISTSCLPRSVEQEPRNSWAVRAHSDLLL